MRPTEYPPEKVFQAQDLYCVDRLTYEATADRTGVSVGTLKRWGDQYDWRSKRSDLAKAESDIRVNTFMARAKMLELVMANGDALTAFAVAKLETLAIEQARFKSEQVQISNPAVPVKIESPAQAAELLENALSLKMGAFMASPESLTLKGIKEYKEALGLLTEMRGRVNDETKKQVGLSQATEDKIMMILKGDL